MSWYVSVELDNGEFFCHLVNAWDGNEAVKIVEDWYFAAGDEIVDLECVPAV